MYMRDTQEKKRGKEAIYTRLWWWFGREKVFSLVLVMLLEAISADGVAVPPLFVLPRGHSTFDDLKLLGIGR